MKKFLSPTIFKIIITIIIVLIAFGGNLFYSRSIIITENGFNEPNLAIRIVNYIANIILYPARLIVNLIASPTSFSPTNVMQNFSLTLLVFLPLIILEGYLVGCIISKFINKKQN